MLYFRPWRTRGGRRGESLQYDEVERVEICTIYGECTDLLFVSVGGLFPMIPPHQ